MFLFSFIFFNSSSKLEEVPVRAEESATQPHLSQLIHFVSFSPF